VFLAVALAVVAISGGPAADAVARWAGAEHDRLPWYATRLLGFLSYAAIALSVVYGLLLSTHLLDAIAHRAVSFTLHQDLAAIGLGLGLVHAALLTLDRTVPFHMDELLIPFQGPYRPLWVGLGQLALYLTIVVVASFSVRRRIGQRRWRALHYLTFLVFAAVTAHGLMAGSDASAPWALWGYVGTGATVAFLTAYRIVVAMAPPPHARQRSA
jgi:predicted ferric reductase